MADLYLYDSDFDAGQEKIITNGMFSITGKLVPVDDWTGLAKAIQKHARIGRLAFSFHSFGGGKIVGSEGASWGKSRSASCSSSRRKSTKSPSSAATWGTGPFRWRRSASSSARSRWRASPGGCKPWKEAVKKSIKLADAAATEKAYDASPIVAFELLTVTLK